MIKQKLGSTMEKYRITPKWVDSLKSNEVFVFGSNLSGRHGAGAAKLALRWGAIYGQAEGIQGQTYAIPTVDAAVKSKLPLTDIKKYIDIFYAYALKHSDKIFLVTEIGCGLAGWTPFDIAPLFPTEIYYLKNVYLPRAFLTTV